mmetsp:Transcript_27810/g.67295  ORF Transcript_27810/g.67295 Transcript_27810/m.67295 type:complete len:265 (-) Transcript_27810:417-1211(-)
MKTCVHAPPRLPHPPTIPFAVPAMSLANILDGQNCDMTKLDPAIPMKSRITARPVALLTSPTHAVGIDAAMRTNAMGSLAPYESQTGPIMILMKIAVTSFVMDDVHTSSFVKLSVSWISFSNGAGANQIMNAVKNETQAQCNALMCGRLTEHSLMIVARSPSSWSTGTSYRSYFDWGLDLNGSRAHSSHSSRRRIASCSSGSSWISTVLIGMSVGSGRSSVAADVAVSGSTTVSGPAAPVASTTAASSVDMILLLLLSSIAGSI